jgi:hypothetical protein
MEMTVTITRLFDDYETARDAVRNLEAAGLGHDDIGIVSNNAEGWFSEGRNPARERHEGTAGEAGAGVGAVVGGGAGLLAGLGMMAIPGLGPVVAAGWIASTALGAVVGGAAGGLIGSLVQSGVSEEDAHVYAEGVRRGGTLVTARVPDADRSRYEIILNRAAVNAAERAAAYRSSGWTQFDPSGTPYSPDQIRREREAYRQRGAA